jgi:hypothetical protein
VTMTRRGQRRAQSAISLFILASVLPYDFTDVDKKVRDIARSETRRGKRMGGKLGSL